MKDEEIAVPSVFVVTRDRRIVWQQVGETVWDRADLGDLLEAIDQAKGR
jgi:hypothetical protein